ncbi:uncharacterized protein LOC118186102 [Stegodyphus dumicola]|uniref:uncharacterized protein LOC118186102 n=1 Tax=Stegodyphus dumicola TaxID=202533 RepID=UPI0015A9225A|nr:uncharacterized protein LOC118186102 [Stegodyphus dumicola]XP_035212016.1 uncharacterized protein LOC118186102 [Stegodyphus dumicola]
MLASQIYKDSKENANVIIKDTKLNVHKKLKCHSKGFKDSTNTKKAEKTPVASDHDTTLDRYPKKEEKTFHMTKEPTVYGDQEEWSDIENMHIYVEPEDDYEDILPKCERIQKADIDILFSIHPFYSEPDTDRSPSPPPAIDFKDLFTDLLPSPVMESSLYSDMIIKIPELDNPFLNLDVE